MSEYRDESRKGTPKPAPEKAIPSDRSRPAETLQDVRSRIDTVKKGKP